VAAGTARKSLTKLTWDNAALIAPATARGLALISGDVVELKQGGQTVRIPVWIAPGQAADTLTLHLGYGRTRAGRTGTGIGFAVNALRTTSGPTRSAGVQLTKTATATSWRARRTTGRSKGAT
jgi:molybdopterin-containing oxidoreductase family iron-sulfur binding subunit